MLLIALVVLAAHAPEEARSRPASQPAVPVRSVANRTVGFTIDAPANAESAGCDAARCQLNAPIGGGDEIQVTVERWSEPWTPALAEERAIASGSSSFEKRERAKSGRYLLVKTPLGNTQEVWSFIKTRRGHLAARCAATPPLRNTCVLICESLRGL